METLSAWINWSLHTWASLPLLVQAYIVLVFFVSVVIQMIKNVYAPRLPPKTSTANREKRKSILYLVAYVSGAVITLLAWQLSPVVLHKAFWVGGMLTTGWTATRLHFVSRKILWPWIKARFMKAGATS